MSDDKTICACTDRQCFKSDMFAGKIFKPPCYLVEWDDLQWGKTPVRIINIEGKRYSVFRVAIKTDEEQQRRIWESDMWRAIDAGDYD